MNLPRRFPLARLGSPASFSTLPIPKSKRDREIDRARARRVLKSGSLIDRNAKTSLCKHVLATGTCPDGAKCQFAHSPADLRTPDYVNKACEAAKNENRPVSALDMRTEYQKRVFLTRRNFLPVLAKVKHHFEASTVMETNAKTKTYEAHVEKAILEVSLTSLANVWGLQPVQTRAVELVFGPRFDANKGLVRLIRRNRKPFGEVFNEATAWDPLIKELCEVVEQVTNTIVDPYVDVETDLGQYRGVQVAFKRLASEPEGKVEVILDWHAEDPTDYRYKVNGKPPIVWGKPDVKMAADIRTSVLQDEDNKKAEKRLLNERGSYFYYDDQHYQIAKEE